LDVAYKIGAPLAAPILVDFIYPCLSGDLSDRISPQHAGPYGSQLSKRTGQVNSKRQFEFLFSRRFRFLKSNVFADGIVIGKYVFLALGTGRH
jgi:hypothetical protein